MRHEYAIAGVIIFRKSLAGRDSGQSGGELGRLAGDFGEPGQI